jgi:hypothetical protein
VGGKSLLYFDPDLDGDMDVVIGQEQCDDLFYLENTGSLIQEEFKTFTKNFPSNAERIDFVTFPAVYSGDWNNDGVMDLIAAPNLRSNPGLAVDYERSIWFYEGAIANNEILFQNPVKGFLQHDMIDLGENANLSVADFDQDGVMDWFISNRGSSSEMKTPATVKLLAGNQDQSFDLIESDYFGISQLQLFDLSLVFTDLNDDRSTDLLLLGNRRNNISRIYYLLNKNEPGSEFNFDINELDSLDHEFNQPARLQAFDVDNDADLDLIVTEQRRIGNQLNLLENQGNLDFRLVDEAFLGFQDILANKNLSIALADFDNNGTVDLVYSDLSGILKFSSDIFSQQVSPSIALITISEEADPLPSRLGESTYLTALDIDEDGDSDLISGTSAGGLTILMNTGEITPPVESKRIFSIFPNPVDFGKNLKILSFEAANYEIVSIFGQILKEQFFLNKNENVEIDVNSFPNGIYIIRATGLTGDEARRFVVQK